MNWIYWLPTVGFLIHIAEEFGRFPSWATRHFGQTSRAWYVYSHIFLVALFVSTSWGAYSGSHSFMLAAVALQWIIGTNALFHVIATILFKEYSPGLVTGSLVVLPAACLVSWIVVDGHVFTFSELIVAFTGGVIVSMAVIASLWADFGIDWFGRRTRS